MQSDVLTREGDFPNDLHMRARGEQAHRRAGFLETLGTHARDYDPTFRLENGKRVATAFFFKSPRSA